VIAALDRWFFGPTSVHPLVLCRILLGLVVVAAYLGFGSELRQLFGDGGINHYVLQARWDDIAPIAPGVYIAVLIAAIAFTLGLLTPVSGLVVFAGHVYFKPALETFADGWIQIIHAFVLYLSLSACNRFYALDRVIARCWRIELSSDALAPAWPLRLIQCHIAAVYVGAALHRLDDPAWLQGQMVFSGLTTSLFFRFPSLDLYPIQRLLELVTWATWGLELVAPIALWIDRFRIRTVTVVLLLGMHAALELFSLTGYWQYMMIAVLVCFAPPRWATTVLDRTLGRIGGYVADRRRWSS
jgi:hypothetical protein